MTKTLYDPTVEHRDIERGIERIVKNMLLMRMDFNVICKTADVSEAYVFEHREELVASNQLPN